MKDLGVKCRRAHSAGRVSTQLDLVWLFRTRRLGDATSAAVRVLTTYEPALSEAQQAYTPTVQHGNGPRRHRTARRLTGLVVRWEGIKQ